MKKYIAQKVMEKEITLKALRKKKIKICCLKAMYRGINLFFFIIVH